ncbi:L [Kumasi rhabdovirus]|uniref:Replicase n=1 Tax=Kumasi rhabdovirus TaxID=1537975 RepID=A0A0C4ME19_9RHAB|nr:L [Kumasi rhabdovirus] [Kumasi rhabdovirus]AIL31438.1 L [Kumasi rhabdovirus] [Kumasi rhabdovirus]
MEDYCSDWSESFDDLDLSSESDFDSQEETFNDGKFHFQHLNQNDYSLNSPLVSDDLDGYLAHRTHKEYPRVFRQKDWSKRDRLFDHIGVNFSTILPSNKLHRWWSRVSQVKDLPVTRCKRFLEAVMTEASETFCVPQTFYKGWIKKDLKNHYEKRLVADYETLKWGELFLMMHDLIIILNHNSEEELKEISRLLKIKKVKSASEVVGLTVNTHLGPCYVTGKVLYFPEHKVIIDRLFALMMKDTWIARFNTTVGLHYRTEHIYTQEEIKFVNSLYRAGDKVLESLGNDAYNCIKLLEPICNWKFCEMAKGYRPLIPTFPNFTAHVNASIDEVGAVSFECTQFCEKIKSINTLEVLTVVYGSFRHWGHPFINYLEGLEALHTQVNMPKTIDQEYAEILGSDLAYCVLRKKFVEDKKWYVDKTQVPQNHPFYSYIHDNIWPTPKVIEDFGDRWNTLPLIKCFDIPEVIDPSLLYSDKSHSRNRHEVVNFLLTHPGEPIPTEKVLNTLLHKEGTNWPEFLREVDLNGLPSDDLIIGLKGKEREVKVKGRFFSLMSWKLREYFVVTEYLIKEHYVPLFNGLTMADDMTTVISKLMDRTQGQGGSDYSQICIANHIDYEKWNNHQRKDATGPVFKVMGQFLGYPNLIYRTHEFFENSWIYYNGRPDLMTVRDGRLLNSTPQRVCWEGQLGGLEGLRQKGWTVVGLLMIRREARIRNTAVKILAQGDNQVICTQYKLRPHANDEELIKNLQDIWNNNNAIMSAIKRGTDKLGLIINEDETMQSADYLNYGKIPVFRGRILNLFTKRLSRIMCVTNDQILSFGNIMSTVSTNCLTISHFDTGPLDAILYYNFFGNMTRLMIERHNPVLGCATHKAVPQIMHNLAYKLRCLYLDPSLGGACGTSLSRFLCRAFPDPVTESLSFWKLIARSTNNHALRLFAISCGYPDVREASQPSDISKLLEKPNSLNIPKNMSLTNLLKTEIKKSLQQSTTEIQNKTIRDSVIYLNANEQLLMDYLWTISPLFPKFLSEFRAATFIGITDGLVSLFQNARTIRTAFSKKLYRDINYLTWECEIGTFRYLSFHVKEGVSLWDCSAHHADSLRFRSWGRPVIGTTIPHPLEMFGTIEMFKGRCTRCDENSNDYITCLAPQGFSHISLQKGPYVAYLGSRTSESTSILQPWDKESNVSLIRRAVKLRNAIHWFVEPDSRLSKSILSVLQGLTGEEWSDKREGFKRTGSALHRFSCSRMSSGGYAACNPSKLGWMIISTDTFSIIGSDNFDFMFQPSIIYGQASLGEVGGLREGSLSGHLHLSCKACLRKIEEPTLDSPREFKHPDVSWILRKWKPDTTPWFKTKAKYEIDSILVENLTKREVSYQAGRAGGFIMGNMILGDQLYLEESSLFPLSIQNKVLGSDYLEGVLNGMLRSSTINALHRRNVNHPRLMKATIMGSLIYCINELTLNKSFLTLCRKGPILEDLCNSPHKVPPTYPISDKDMGLMARSWLKRQAYRLERDEGMIDKYPKIVVFSDLVGSEVMGPYLFSSMVVKELFVKHVKGKTGFNKKRINQLRELSTNIQTGTLTESLPSSLLKNGRTCPEEVRHACKSFKNTKCTGVVRLDWGKEIVGDIISIELTQTETPPVLKEWDPLKIPKVQSPLITGLRFAQLATGAHYKLRSIIVRMGIGYQDFLCGGDGSGGMSACLARINPLSHYIYNSLVEYQGTSLRGSSPGVPPAIGNCSPHPFKCVNGETAWMEPSDLSQQDTWLNFKRLASRNNLNIDLIVLDMEIRDKLTQLKIESNLESHGLEILNPGGSVIYKCYASDLNATPHSNALQKLGKYFKHVFLVSTSFSGSFTSEMYAVFMCRLHKTSKNKHIELCSLRNALTRCYALSTHESELQRACNISYGKMVQGVPPSLIPDLKVQFETLFSIMGVETGLGYSLSERISTVRSQYSGEIVLSCVVVGLNSIISVTSESNNTWKIPSDGELLNLLVCVVGLGYWISWKTSNVKLYQYLDKLIEISPVIAIIKGTGKKSPSKKRLTWDIGGKGHIFKKIGLGPGLAGIGSWIRALGSLDVHINSLRLHPPTLSDFNKGLTEHKVCKRTGFYSILENFKLCESDMSQDLLDTPEPKETSWQD